MVPAVTYIAVLLYLTGCNQCEASQQVFSYCVRPVKPPTDAGCCSDVGHKLEITGQTLLAHVFRPGFVRVTKEQKVTVKSARISRPPALNLGI